MLEKHMSELCPGVLEGKLWGLITLFHSCCLVGFQLALLGRCPSFAHVQCALHMSVSRNICMAEPWKAEHLLATEHCIQH